MSQENVEIVRAIYEQLARGDAAITQQGRPRRSQTVVEGRWWVVMTLPGGELARTEVFPDRVQALEAAGLRE